MVLGGSPVRPDAVDLRWVPALLYRNGEIEETGVAAGVLTTRPPASPGSRTSSHQHGDAPEAGEIILAGSFTRPDVGVRAATPCCADYGPMGSDHMPLRLRPAPSATRSPTADRPARRACGCAPAARSSPRSAPGAGLDWLLIDMEHSPQRARVRCSPSCRPSPPTRSTPGRARADRRHRDDQAGPRPRRAEPPRADGLTRPTRPRAVVAAVRYPPRGRPRRRLGAGPVRALEPRRRTTSPNADEHVSLFVQIETAAGVETPRPRSPRSTASTASSSGPSDLAASMGLLGQQTHPDVVAAVLRTFEAVRAAGKPVGVNAFDPPVAAGLPRRRGVLRAGRRRRRAARPRLRGPG